MTPAVATGRLLCAPPCVGTALCVYRLACGPLNNMTPAVAIDRLLCAPPCVGTAFCVYRVYRLACGPLNNLTWGCLGGGGGCVGTARWFGRPTGRLGSGGPAGRLGRPNHRALVRPADTTAEPNHRNLTGRAEPPPRVPPVHSVQPGRGRGHESPFPLTPPPSPLWLPCRVPVPATDRPRVTGGGGGVGFPNIYNSKRPREALIIDHAETILCRISGPSPFAAQFQYHSIKARHGSPYLPPPHPPTSLVLHAPLCDIPSGCCSFAGPWTVTRSSLRMLRPVAAFCRPLQPVLLLVSFPRSRSPVVGVLGLC